MKFCPDFATNSRKEWCVSLFQSNLRKQIRKLPKIDFDTLFSIFWDLFNSVFAFFMIFVRFFHSSWTDAAALPILLFSLSAVVRHLSQFAARAAVSEFFFLGISTALSGPWSSPKFLEILVLSWAPHARTLALRARTHFQVMRRGLRNISDACPLSFPFSVFPFRPGNLGLFGAPLQPPAPKRYKKIWKK